MTEILISNPDLHNEYKFPSDPGRHITSTCPKLNNSLLRMLFIPYQVLTLPKEPVSTVEGLGCI